VTECLRFERIAMRFPNGLNALENIDLAIPRGAFIALVGPSGSGKSTLLRLGAGLAQPSTGAVIRPAALRVSVVFQDATLMPWARIEDNVALPLRLAGTPREEARKRAADLLDLVGLQGFSKSYPSELSGGMKMRASLARALITEPELLLLDEPFAALDEITRQQLNDALLALWSRSKPAILFITHSVYEATYLAEEIYVLSPRPGRILERVSVGASYPREAEFRLSPGFAEVARQVSHAIARGFSERTHAA
jgi:NitT/TauT family transport system ATP-binding protein